LIHLDSYHSKPYAKHNLFLSAPFGKTRTLTPVTGAAQDIYSIFHENKKRRQDEPNHLACVLWIKVSAKNDFRHNFDSCRQGCYRAIASSE
jgi:hypothetical protein